ncbi:MAG: carboxypeptidase-like regulatory domain-containing protein [Bacteroidetes bacterium]|nr:carboxypeptidase-like regulatory domain-containing protein [Bacteroidota bacterium]
MEILLKKLHFWCWIFLLPASYTGNHAFAQKQYNFFYGKVYQAGTKSVIPNVNLAIEGSRIGTVTDKTGSFSFFIDTIPATLVVSCVGFETKTILLDATSFSLTLYLSKKATELQEVEIKANVHEAFFKDVRYAVLDYELDSNMVYLLIFKRYLSKSELICKSIYGDTIATSAPFYFKPERLYKDCLGNLHVLSHDSGFQVFRQGSQLHLIHPVNLKKFDDILKNCVAATPDILFFQKVTDHSMGVEYFGVNRKTLLVNPIAQLRDEKKLKMLRRNAKDAQLLANTTHPDSRDDFVTWNYVHKILYRPMKTSLYLIDGFTCIFNTPEQQMEFYDSTGKYSYKLALKTAKIRDGQWTSEILTDERSQKVFTTFVSNGQYSLYEIDLNTGMMKKRQTLFHYYPEKIKVYNYFVYYLYDVPGNADNKMLYRQKF